MFSRRSFLQSLGATGLVAWSATAPRFLGKAAAATPTLGSSGAKDTILVVLQLTGGNDGLNTIIPIKDPLYAKNRPTLKQAPDRVKPLADGWALHPAMEGFATLWQDSSLSIVHSVGYPNPSQSHFRSMDIWQAGSTAEILSEGWLGRALARVPNAQAFHLADNNEAAPFALTGAPAKVPSVTNLADLELRFSAQGGKERQLQQKLVEAVASGEAPTGSLLDFVQQTAVSTYAAGAKLRSLGDLGSKVTYPETGLGRKLKLTAQLIDAGLGARIFYLTLDGFDTHAAQEGAHARLLGDVAGSVAAFFKDLGDRGQRDRVLLLTFSEFGRRVRENGSQGTDHGAGAPLFLVGGNLKPGLIGPTPRLDDLDDGNLKHAIDFRSVYATVLDHWLGVPSAEVLGRRFAPFELFKS